MASPNVSICVPAHNAAGFLEKTLESALQQTYKDFEVVVWDDGSTDGTPEVVRRMGDRRIRLFTSAANRGSAHSTNMTMRLASGRFIKFLHHDDILEPDCLERFLEVMDGDASVGLTFSRREILDEGAGAELTAQPEPHRGLGELCTVNDGATLFRRLMESDFKLNGIGEPSNVMIRRDRLARSGLCNTRVRQLLDLDLWLRVIFDCAVGFVDAKLSRFRFHSGSLTTMYVGGGLHWLDGLWLLEGLSTVPDLWTRYPQLARRRAWARSMLPRDIGWLARNGQLRRHHLVEVALYWGYLARASVGRPPVIVEPY